MKNVKNVSNRPNFGSFFGFFSVVNIGGFWKHRKMAIFWSNRHTHVWNSQFLGPLFVDLLDAKGHFSCFLKKVLFMGGNKKKVVFSLFFFWIKKIQKFTVFSPWDPLFSHFLDQKKRYFLWHQGKRNLKMRNVKIWKIVKSLNLGFTLKFPKNIFLVVFFQKNCQILKSWFFKSTQFWVIFWLFFRCQHRGILKTSKNGHFLIKSAYSCMEFSIFGTTFCRSVGR